MKSKLIYLQLILFILFSSCSTSTFKVLERNGNCPVMLEKRKMAGFDLRLTNQSDSKLSNCYIILDNKYKHSLEGLYSQERGLIKDSTIYPHEVCTLLFSGDVSNLYYFNIQEIGFIPDEIKLECNGCSSTWKF